MTTALRRPLPNRRLSPRVLDLFAGIGGFSLGLERAGMQTVGFCEIDQFCQQVLAKHWTGVPIHGDITTLAFKPGSADVITGGFPCQDVSLAGKRAGLAGSRSGLYRELVRAIRVVRPRHAIMENVAALLSDGMGTVLGGLAEIGADAEWDCVPACAVGAPHERDRVWIVAHPHGLDGRAGAGRQDRAEAGDRVEARASSDVADANGLRGLQPTISRDAVGLRAGDRAENAEHPDAARVGRGQGRTWRPPDSFARIRDEARRNVADPYGARLAFREGLTRDAWEKLTPAQRDAFENVGQSIWPDEPGLSGVDDGIPYELDCIRRFFAEQGDNQKSVAKDNFTVGRFLRAMWECREIAAPSPDLYRRRLRDRVPEMPYSDTHGGWHMGERIEENKGLRDLWEAIYTKPLEETQDVRRRVLERIRAAERAKALEWSGRTKATGNAVVPQIVEMIGLAIMDADSEMGWSAAT